MRRLFLYGVLGLSKTLFSIALYYLFYYLDFGYYLSNVIAFIIIYFYSIFFSSNIIFNHNRTFSTYLNYLLYSIVYILSSSGIFYVISNYTSYSSYSPIISSALLFFPGFFLSRLIFK